MDNYTFQLERNNDTLEELFSKVIKAGRRTYFFDVKATRAGERYIVITESRKKQGEGNTVHYEKRKLYLYKEDFCKFANGLREVVEFATEGNSNDQEINFENSLPVVVLEPVLALEE